MFFCFILCSFQTSSEQLLKQKFAVLTGHHSSTQPLRTHSKKQSMYAAFLFAVQYRSRHTFSLVLFVLQL
jgi:hypothetical protein